MGLYDSFLQLEAESDGLPDYVIGAKMLQIVFADIESQLSRTRNRGDQSIFANQLANAVLGLCGEAGEVGDLIKKQLFHGHTANPQKIAEELGDVLYYVFWIANLYNLTVDQIIAQNIQKLYFRYPDGFDSERSRNRYVDELVAPDETEYSDE